MYKQPSNTLIAVLTATYIAYIWSFIQTAPVFTVLFIISSVLLFKHYADNY